MAVIKKFSCEKLQDSSKLNINEKNLKIYVGKAGRAA